MAARRIEQRRSGSGRGPGAARRLPAVAALALAVIAGAVIALASPATACCPTRTPANDDFAGAELLAGPSGTTSGTTMGASLEPGEPGHAGYGARSVWYRWTAPADGAVAFDTFGSDFQPVLGVYTGDRVDALTLVAENSDAGGSDQQAEVAFAARAGVTYHVAADDRSLSLGLLRLSWHPATTPAHDAVAAALDVAGAEGTTSLSSRRATMEADEPVHAGVGRSSVWVAWTAPVDGDIAFDTFGSTFDTVLAVYSGDSPANLSAVAANDDADAGVQSQARFRAQAGGRYLVAVSGYRGATGAVSLQWGHPAGPPNDDLDAAEVLTVAEGRVNGATNVLATREPGEPAHAGSGGASVWFRWHAPFTGPVVFDTFFSDIDTVLAAYTGDTVDALTLVAENDEFGAGGGSQVTFDAVAGTVYHLAVDGYLGITGPVGLHWFPAARPDNDRFADAVVLAGEQGSLDGRNALQPSIATTEPGEPFHGGGGGASVWYRWTAPRDMVVAFDTLGSAAVFGQSTLDSVLAVYVGDAVDTLTEVASNDEAGRVGPLASRVVFRATAGTTYSLAVAGRQLHPVVYAADVGAFRLRWRPAEAAANDDFADAVELSGVTGTITGSNDLATRQPGEPQHPVLGHTSVWYRWTAPVSGPVSFDTFGSAIDTLLAVYRGDALDALDQVAADDDALGTLASQVTFDAVAGEAYRIAVDGFVDAYGPLTLSWRGAPANDDFAASIALSGGEGSIAAHNLFATTEPGEPAHAGTGGASIWFSWTAPDDTPVSFGTSDSDMDTVLAVYRGDDVASLTEVGSADDVEVTCCTLQRDARVLIDPIAGATYHIVVDGFAGATGRTTLRWATRPANDDLGRAAEIGGASGALAGSNRNATVEPGEPDHGGHFAEQTVWFRWTAPEDMALEVTTESGFDTVIGVYTGDAMAELAFVAEDDDSGAGLNARARFRASAGTTYVVAVGGVFEHDAGAFTLSWRAAVANDDRADAEELTGASGEVAGSNGLATMEPGEPAHAGVGGASVWYRWTAPADMRVSFATSGDFGTALAVYEPQAAPDGSLVEIAANDDLGRSSFSLVRFDASTGATYLLAVASDDPERTGDFTLRWAEVPSPVNDDFADALVLAGPDGSVAGDSSGAFVEPGEPRHEGAGGASVWFRWTAPADGPVAFNTAGTEFAVALAVYTGDPVDSLARVAGDASFEGDAALDFVATAGTSYSLALDTVSSNRIEGPWQLRWHGVPPNDDVAAAVDIAGDGGTVTGWNQLASVEPGEPAHGFVGTASVWYRWTAPASGEATFDLEGLGFAPVLAVYTGDAVDDLTLVASALSFGDVPATARFAAEATVTYLVAAAGFFGDTGELSLSWSVTSGVAPPNDAFAAAVPIDGAAGSVAGSNAFATGEPGEPEHAGVGQRSVWYRWTAPADGAVSFDTTGAGFDTVLAVYAGESVDALTGVVANDDLEPGDLTSRVTFTAVAGTAYHVAVAGFAGAAGGFELHWQAGTTVANDDFTDAIVLRGGEGRSEGVTINAGAGVEPGEPVHAGVGTASVWYRWTAPSDGRVGFETLGTEFDSVLAVYTGSAVDDLTLVGESREHQRWNQVSFVAEAGETYHVAVAGSGGATGRITLAWYPPPPNDDLAAAEPFVIDESVSARTGIVHGDNLIATDEPGEPAHAGNGHASVWYRWVAPHDGTYLFDTARGPREFDTTLAIYTGDGDGPLSALTLVAENDDSPVGLYSELRVPLTGGITYLVAVAGFGGQSGAFALYWEDQTPPPNDRFTRATVLDGELGGVTGGQMGYARTEPGEPVHGGTDDGGHSVWYRWTAPRTATYTWRTDFSEVQGFDPILAVYTGAALDQLTLVAVNDNADHRTTEALVVFEATAGVTYHVAVAGSVFFPHVGGFALHWSTPPVNDDIAAATVLDGPEGTASGNGVVASVESGEPEHGFEFGNRTTVWYRWTAPTDGDASFTATFTAPFDKQLLVAVYGGTELASLEPVAASVPGPTSTVVFRAAAGATYSIAVDTAFGSRFDLQWVLRPTNDAWAAAAELGGSAGVVTGSNRLATTEPGEPVHAGTGTASVWYRFTATGEGKLEIETAGSTFDTVVAVYTGSAVDGLVLLDASDDVRPNERTSRLKVKVDAGVTYWVAVSGSGGATGDVTLAYTVRDRG